MRVMTGGDWSTGFGSDRTLEAALTYRRLGEDLREHYTGVLSEPLPEQLHGLLKQLSENTDEFAESGSRDEG